jgi:predicted nucleotidyltransferase
MKNKPAAVNIEKIKAYLREKEKIRRQKQQQEFDQTARKLKAMTHIWIKYKIKRVYLYGSVTCGKVHRESDIDIALEGDINYRQLLTLFSEVDRHFSREIDIRDLEELPFKEAVKEKGVVVYEK